MVENYFTHLGGTPPSRDELFEAVAGKYFPEWKEAKKRLDAAQKNLDSHTVPLGSIGHALDGGVMTDLEDKVMMALVDFTMINERLHQDKNIKAAVDLLKYIQVTLPASEQESLRAMRVNKQFENAVASKGKPVQSNAVQSNWMEGSLSRSFRNHRRQRLSTHKTPFHSVLNDGLRHLLKGISTDTPEKKLETGKTPASLKEFKFSKN
jgi:hypothetical protein